MSYRTIWQQETNVSYLTVPAPGIQVWLSWAPGLQGSQQVAPIWRPTWGGGTCCHISIPGGSFRPCLLPHRACSCSQQSIPLLRWSDPGNVPKAEAIGSFYPNLRSAIPSVTSCPCGSLEESIMQGYGHQGWRSQVHFRGCLPHYT
jgi:hypothetical protein